jgi:hypothetical protein
VLPIGLGGCFLAPWSPDRPQGPVSGPGVYVERCDSCHTAGTGQPYGAGLHTAKGLRCGQCHAGSNHPDFTQPVRDATCGGCHQAEFQQTLASKHFATRVVHALDTDRPARAALRRDRFVAVTAGTRRFAGDAASGALGGRLCAACQYDEHRLGLAAVQRAGFCTGCHENTGDHFPGASTGNRCLSCHVRVGETVAGQVVNTHRFAVPGAGGTGR